MSLKVRIEVDENLTEDEVIIRCRDINKEVVNIKQSITDVINEKRLLYVQEKRRNILLLLTLFYL